MKYRQCLLKRKEPEFATIVCYLDVRPDLQVGKWVTLKGEGDERWEVISMSETMDLPVSAQSQSKTWHNNDL